MNPKTQEYIEAEQESVNQQRNELMEKLSFKDQKKFDIVEEVVKRMVDNKLLFSLYLFLPHPDYKKDIAWQWNSIAALTEYNKDDGKFEKEAFERAGHFCEGMINTIFINTTDYFLGKEATLEERWKYFQSYIWTCLKQYSEYSKEIQ